MAVNTSLFGMKRLYFLGIGGTAMGAVAGACVDIGITVSGSDSAVYPPMSDFLRDKGILYYDGYAEEHINAFQPDAVIVGNAMSRGNVELEYALEKRLPLLSLPELVKSEFIRRYTSVVIAGTHGKTTTSSLAAWVLYAAGKPTGFLIGAITGNFGLGCRALPQSNEEGYFVSEGDEYDSAFFDKRSKFLSYRPDIAVINNIEFDHADIFSSLEDIKKSFRLFARLVPRNGVIIANADDGNVSDVLKSAVSPVESFGFSSSSFWRAVDIHYDEKETHFTVLRKGFIFGRFSTRLAGEHNVRNTLAIIAVAHHAGISAELIQQALQSFVLPKRRLEEIATWKGATVVDDFAHHPTAIHLTLRAAAQRYPQRRIIACFEPRSNTTTRSFFQNDFANCFDDADVVVLGRVNRPERYPPNERLDTQRLAEDLTARGKQVFLTPQDEPQGDDWGLVVASFLSDIVQEGDVLMLLSNGDFGGLRNLLQSKP